MTDQLAGRHVRAQHRSLPGAVGGRRLLRAATALVVLSVGACGGDSSGPGAAPAEGPSTLGPAATTSPEGTTRVTCDLTTDDGPVRFALDLPEGFRPAVVHHQAGEPVDCAWHRRVVARDAAGFRYRPGVRVSVGYVEPDAPTLEDLYDDQQVNAVEGDDPQDDDSILHLDLARDVPVFGATVGDRLSFLCFCDGQNTITRYAQAAGVRLEWSSVAQLQEETDQQLEAVLAGAGTGT